MSLKSPSEDLSHVTLRAVSGLLGKLDYLEGLRRPDGRLWHWGLVRLHGELSAQRALEDAYNALLSQALRTRLPDLVQDLEVSSRWVGISSPIFLQKLRESTTSEVSGNQVTTKAKHLSSVLYALSLLLQVPDDANPPAS